MTWSYFGIARFSATWTELVYSTYDPLSCLIKLRYPGISMYQGRMQNAFNDCCTSGAPKSFYVVKMIVTLKNAVLTIINSDKFTEFRSDLFFNRIAIFDSLYVTPVWSERALLQFSFFIFVITSFLVNPPLLVDYLENSNWKQKISRDVSRDWCEIAFQSDRKFSRNLKSTPPVVYESNELITPKRGGDWIVAI